MQKKSSPRHLALVSSVSAALAYALLLLLPIAAEARRIDVLNVNGREYLLVSGFAAEPAILGERAVLEVSLFEAEQSLAGLKTREEFERVAGPPFSHPIIDRWFSVEITAPNTEQRRSVFFLYSARPDLNTLASFVPTMAGVYTFTFQGSIEETPYSFSAPCVFSDPHRGSGVDFKRQELAPGVVWVATAGGIQCPVPPEPFFIPSELPKANPTSTSVSISVSEERPPAGIPLAKFGAIVAGIGIMGVLFGYIVLRILRRRQQTDYFNTA